MTLVVICLSVACVCNSLAIVLHIKTARIYQEIDERHSGRKSA